MLDAIRREYGEPLVTVGCESFYSFPSLEALAKATQDDLRKLGLGYRARYLVETIALLQSLGGEEYLHKLRAISDPVKVQDELLQFSGVGRKVADCVALFSLQQDSAIPVDVHVWNIARRDYDPEGVLVDVKSLTPTIYRQVGDLFRSRFSSKSGWAHSLLFVAELPSFRAALPTHLVEEMDRVSAGPMIGGALVIFQLS
jgi:N-glycosylase/DNA lyase